MEDYPRNLIEFDARFGTEDACREYLFQRRWPDGFRCPRCECQKTWPVREVLLQCAECGYQTSVTAGTIFQDTRTPLRSGNVVDHHPEERGQRFGIAAGVGPEAVPDLLDMAAQTAERDGQAGPRFADWQGGSR